jgi:hypothetical protein
LRCCLTGVAGDREREADGVTAALFTFDLAIVVVQQVSNGI